MAITYRYGTRLSVPMLPGASVDFAVGDLVYASAAGTIKPAASLTWDTNLATTQTAFKAAFVGVCQEAYDYSDPPSWMTHISVDISSESLYEAGLASATLDQFDIVGVAKASGNALENQKVVEAVAACSIARVMRHYSSAVTKALLSIVSSIGPSSANAQAQI